MGKLYETLSDVGPIDYGYIARKHSLYQPPSAPLSCIDIRVFYVRVSKYDMDESTPEKLIVNHIPLNHDTLLDLNGVRSGIYTDGVTTILRRDRLDKKFEEAIFVSTDCIRTTGSLKFEVFDQDVLVLFGVLELCSANGHVGETKKNGQKWSLNCWSDITSGAGFFKGKQFMGRDWSSPKIEVYVAGSYLGTPIVLTETLQVSCRKKHQQNVMLDTIPESESNETREDNASMHSLQLAESPNHKSDDEYLSHLYQGEGYLDEYDGELSWFNAGVRVGVGIGLSLCVGIGLGMGLLVRTLQGSTRGFRRRLL